MLWLFAGVAIVAVVVLGFVVLGRETGLQSARARPAVFDLEEAVTFIGDALPEDVASRITHDDVRWVLRADVNLLEQATVEGGADGIRVVDEDAAVASILGAPGAVERGLSDEDVVAVLQARLAYLEAIGAVGPEVQGPDEPLA